MATRRSNREGSITKLPSGSWRVIIMDGYTKDGKRNMVSFTAPTRTAAVQKMRKYQYERENDLIVARSKDNQFGTWADSWYEDHKTQVQPSTYSGYLYTLNLLKEAFGDSFIDEIRPIDINQYLNQLYVDGSSHSKISKCRAMLIQIFNFAEGNDAVKKNPARFAKSIRNTDFTSSKDAFTEEEMEILMRDLPNDKMGHSIRSLLGSGMRVQELLALMPEEIAADGSCIRIRRAVKMVAGKAVEGPPKSKAGYRDIPIPTAFRASVLYLKNHASGKYVWCNGDKLHCIGSFRKWYCRVMKGIHNVRYLPPHCCRHTYVSLLEARGVPMEQIARLAGHSKITTTNGYLHIRENTLQDAVEVLNGTTAQQLQVG